MMNNPVIIAVVALTDPVTSWTITMMGKLEFKASLIEPNDVSITMTIA
jgi:hypothetical protein